MVWSSSALPAPSTSRSQPAISACTFAKIAGSSSGFIPLNQRPRAAAPLSYSRFGTSVAPSSAASSASGWRDSARKRSSRPESAERKPSMRAMSGRSSPALRMP